MTVGRLEMLLALCTLLLLPLPCDAHAQSTGSAVGARRFVQFCAGCHGADGKGGDKAASLVTNETVINRSDAELFRIVRDGTTEGMPPFAQIGDSNIVAVIHYLRTLEENAAPAGASGKSGVPGDAVAGRALFFGKGRCSTCHMMQGEGGFIAGNLTTYARNRNRGSILQSIVEPDTPLTPSSRVVSVTTKAGQRLTGVLRNEDNFSLELQTVDGRYHLLARSSLTNISYSDHSLMPRDYDSRLTTKDLDNIVSFLIASSRNPHAESPDAQSEQDR